MAPIQGLLALEGELTPILVQMVKSANMNGLLDSDSDSLSSCQQRVKARLHEILQRDRDFTAEDYEKVGTKSCSLKMDRTGQNLSVTVVAHTGCGESHSVTKYTFAFDHYKYYCCK